MSLRVVINTARTVEQGEVVKGGRKLREVYRERAAVCFLHPEDAAELGVGSGDRVLVRTGVGGVVLRAMLSERVQRGSVLLPLSPWANLIIDERTWCTGSPGYKGMVGVVEKTERQVLSIEELMRGYLEGVDTRVDPPPGVFSRAFNFNTNVDKHG